MHLGEKLKSLRSIKGFSVKECSQLIGVAESTYRDWEYGRSIIGEPYVKIAEVLGVSLSHLFGAEKTEVLEDLEFVSITLAKLEGRLNKIKSNL